jgi:hypothetical protein
MENRAGVIEETLIATEYLDGISKHPTGNAEGPHAKKPIRSLSGLLGKVFQRQELFPHHQKISRRKKCADEGSKRMFRITDLHLNH